MNTLVVFIVVILVLAALLSLYSGIRYGSVRNWRDWVPAIVAVLAIAGLLAVTARAQPLPHTTVFFGLEYPDSDGHPACDRGDSQITSNIGIDQGLWRWQSGAITLDLDATYRHHSCAIGDDDRVTDTLGVNAVFRREW